MTDQHPTAMAAPEQAGAPATRITYDQQARAMYVYLSDALVLTTRRITDTVLLDLDADANVVGVELIGVDPPTVEDITAIWGVCRDCEATP